MVFLASGQERVVHGHLRGEGGRGLIPTTEPVGTVPKNVPVRTENNPR